MVQPGWEGNGIRNRICCRTYPRLARSHLRPKELAMANLPLAFAEAVGGGVLLLAGISGESIGNIIRGQFTIQPLTSGASTASAASGPTTGTSGTATTSTAAGSLPSSVVNEVNALAKTKGWNQQQINDWLTIIQHESSGSTTVVNSIGAAGIGQFYSGTPGDISGSWAKYYTYGGDPNSLTGQLTGMMNYIADRYGDPSAAWAQYYNHPNHQGSY